MFFSIIVPIYNTELYLSESIESILNQTFDEFELILINDGSTDRSLEIAISYKEKDNRIKIISQENKGVSTARNKGLALANGNYIFFMDSDDWIVENTLEIIHEKLKIKAYDIVSFSAKPFIDGLKLDNKNEDILKRYTYYYERAYLKEKEYCSDEYQEKMFKHANYVGNACLYVFKISLVKKNNLRLLSGVFHEDNLFTRELLAFAKDVYFIPENLYQRRISYESRSFAKGYFTSPHSYLIISERLYNLSIIKENDINLLKGADYFFYRALCLIKENFKDSKEFKDRLFKLYSNLQLKEYQYEMLKLKYPFLAHFSISIYRIKNKLNRLVKIKK